MVCVHSSTGGSQYNGNRSGHFLADWINEVKSIINPLELRLPTTRVVLLPSTACNHPHPRRSDRNCKIKIPKIFRKESLGQKVSRRIPLQILMAHCSAKNIWMALLLWPALFSCCRLLAQPAFS
jgi:hypothetical protein